jgi:hypothetical protein
MACGAQSPGGLSEGVLTSSTRKRACASRSRCRNARIAARGFHGRRRHEAFPVDSAPCICAS